MVGQCLLNGIGCPKNKEKCVKWYRKAADLGDVYAKEVLEEIDKSQ